MHNLSSYHFPLPTNLKSTSLTVNILIFIFKLNSLVSTSNSTISTTLDNVLLKSRYSMELTFQNVLVYLLQNLHHNWRLHLTLLQLVFCYSIALVEVDKIRHLFQLCWWHYCFHQTICDLHHHLYHCCKWWSWSYQPQRCSSNHMCRICCWSCKSNFQVFNCQHHIYTTEK